MNLFLDIRRSDKSNSSKKDDAPERAVQGKALDRLRNQRDAEDSSRPDEAGSKDKVDGLDNERDLPVDPTRPGEQLDEIVDMANETGELEHLNEVDNFRSRLSPELQQQYDEQLAALREDERIQFEYRDGAEPDAALEDLALRGIVAANFNNPELLEKALENAVRVDGNLDIIVYPDGVPLEDFGYEPGNAAGLATPDNDIAIDTNAFYSFLKNGDNAFVHEFAHLQQRDGDEHLRVPKDFPFGQQFEEAFADPQFQDFLIEKFFGGNPPEEGELALGGAESWATVQNLFHQDPETLKRESPEIYDQMVRYFGLDPVTGESGPAVQLNGSADPQASLEALETHFGDLAGDDGRFSEDDLQRVLEDGDAPVELQSAAAFLLSSEAWRSMVDVGEGRGEVDDNFDLDDVQGARESAASFPTSTGEVETREQALEVISQYGALVDTADGRGGRDFNVSEDDLRALLQDPGTPPDLRAAVEIYLGA